MRKQVVKGLDFLVVGAARSGTTTLFHLLRSHRALFLPAAKEVPFFSEDDRFEGGWETFAEEFLRGAREGQLIGKVTPQYMEDGRVPEKLWRLFPDVRLIAILRNPIDRALSFYRFLRRRNAESQSFEASFFGEGRGAHYYRRPGEYGRVLGAYMDFFSRDRLLILFTDDLERDPTGLASSIQSFLDLDHTFEIDQDVGRYNIGGDNTRFRRLLQAARSLPLARRLWRTIPERRRRAFSRWYFFEMVPRPAPPPVLAGELRARLRDHFSPFVLELEDRFSVRVPWSEFRSLSDERPVNMEKGGVARSLL